MAGIEPDRVAELLVELSGPMPGRRGSGYRVCPSAVLTAAHVVQDAAQVQVRFNADRPGEWMTEARVAWSDLTVDAAVVTITPGPRDEVQVAPVAFGRVVERDGVLECSAMGFPRFKLRNDTARPLNDGSPSQYRDSMHAVGTVAALSNLREGTLDVSVPPPEYDPDPARSPWEGMSGAAVWSAGRIIGVVAEHHRSDGLGRLAATRVDRWYERLSPAEIDKLHVLMSLPTHPDDLTDIEPAPAGRLAEILFVLLPKIIGGFETHSVARAQLPRSTCLSLVQLHKNLARLQSLLELLSREQIDDAEELWHLAGEIMPGPIPGADRMLRKIDEHLQMEARQIAGPEQGKPDLEILAHRLSLLERYISVMRDLTESLREAIVLAIQLEAPDIADNLSRLWQVKISINRLLSRMNERGEPSLARLLSERREYLRYLEASRSLEARVLLQVIDADAREVARDPHTGLTVFGELASHAKDLAPATVSLREHIGRFIVRRCLDNVLYNVGRIA